MTSFQWGIAIGGLTLTTVNIAWLSYQVRKLWLFNVEQSNVLLQVAKNAKKLHERLSNLETDGK